LAINSLLVSVSTVKVEFVVGNTSLSFELYSPSWSCFHSCGVGTFVHGKWCFVLHVQCCGSCVVSTEYSTKQYMCDCIYSGVLVSPVN